MKALFGIFAASMVLLAAPLALAADPTTVMGKWIERLSGGRGLVSVFAPGSISFYPVDESGKPAGAPRISSVTYKDLGGEDVGVVFNRDGSGGVVIHRVSENAVTLDFPGQGAHRLARIEGN